MPATSPWPDGSSEEEASLFAWVAETCGGLVQRATPASGGNRCRSWAIDVAAPDGTTKAFVRPGGKAGDRPRPHGHPGPPAPHPRRRHSAGRGRAGRADQGARCALVTTRGFRNVLELGRRDRQRMYGITGTHTPLIPRDWRWELDERLDQHGTVLRPLDDGEVRRLAATLRE